MDLEYTFRKLNLKIDYQKYRTTCHETARIVHQGMRQHGFQVRLVDGLYLTENNLPIEHSWLENETHIFETDPRQLRERGHYQDDAMPDSLCAVLEKEKFETRYIELGGSVPISQKNIKRVSQKILTRS